MNATEPCRASPKPLSFAAFMLSLALGGCWLNYPSMIFGSGTIAQIFWAGGLSLAAVSALTLLFTVFQYGWLTLRGRCSPVLLVTALGVSAGFTALWLAYYRFLERMP
jgi:hypothetical protein